MLDPIRTKPRSAFLSENRSNDIYGWKKVYYLDYGDDRCPMPKYKIAIAKLIIPKDAAVVFANRKCRASYVIVDGFYTTNLLSPPSMYRKLRIKIAFSSWNTRFCYEDGKIATPDSFDPNPDVECSHGIHFFRTYEEAREYIV